MPLARKVIIRNTTQRSSNVSEATETIGVNPLKLVADIRHSDAAAYAAAGMPRHLWLTVLMLQRLDWSAANELEYALWLVACDIARKGRWRIVTGREYCRRMAGLAIYERADGARFQHEESWALRAGFIGCGKVQWFTVWRARYETVYREFSDWETLAKRWMESSPARIQGHLKQI